MLLSLLRKSFATVAATRKNLLLKSQLVERWTIQCLSSLRHQLSFFSNNIPNRNLPHTLLSNTALPRCFLPNRLSFNDPPNSDLLNSLLSYNDTPNTYLPRIACDSLLPNKHSYSFSFPLLQQVQSIDFTFHSHLHFIIQQWIMSLIPLLKLLILSFRLECFVFSVVVIPLHMSYLTTLCNLFLQQNNCCDSAVTTEK